ncbi:UDP-N-acetylenolpyruvoylglucosamine reductase [Acidisarcina polymorpha]|uniref:UDP-N-acetylenolpyruvoylglucosamine reductase n=2 Tax=Acidisarcina polymorpha TaxID=2211140 RepID=A0A2Z5FSU2_9BACT|nr:UDP-N-acetylmuramate dehydrogenase [Acidisarcina polymorpha]AXC09534.1 UDP-N-acetylenolpyruvoylglucosamine reductase [Acidisarcina polymorpha]
MEFLQNVPLAPFTTLQIGGQAAWFAEAASEVEVMEAVEFARLRALRLFVLGGGSNLLVSDEGFPGLVLRIALKGIKESFEDDKLIVRAGAGEDWDGFVDQTIALDCAGIECLAGIPGTIGGTPVQNVGAYGQEVSQTIRMVRALDLDTLGLVEFTNAECGFGYRQSIFNTSARGKYIVTQVEYEVTPGAPPTLTYADLKRRFPDAGEPPSVAKVASTVRAIRREKGMLLVEGDPDTASAGSFFKNPIIEQSELERIRAAVPANTAIPSYPAGDGKVKLAAAWLLEQTGFTKGYGSGRVGISSRHTLALINRGGATAAEVLGFSNEIVAKVEARFGVRLEREPVFLE